MLSLQMSKLNMENGEASLIKLWLRKHHVKNRVQSWTQSLTSSDPSFGRVMEFFVEPMLLFSIGNRNNFTMQCGGILNRSCSA